jgi:hypothetical protein
MNMMAARPSDGTPCFELWLGADLELFVETDDPAEAATSNVYVVLKQSPFGTLPSAESPVAATFQVETLATNNGLTGWHCSLAPAEQSGLVAGATYAGQVLVELVGGVGFYTELFWLKAKAPLRART